MNVRVSRDEVLAALRTNRADHEETYREAVEGYRRKSEEVLVQKLEALRAGKRVDMSFNLREPQHQLKTFDRIIRMLEMSVDEELELTETQFSSYVMNEWDWMHGFAAGNAMYSAKATAMLADF